MLLDASDGDQVWGSIGVSENVIEASWEALVDSLEYGMQARRAGVRLRDGASAPGLVTTPDAARWPSPRPSRSRGP